MSDEDLEDFEPDLDDLEREDDEKETEEWEDYRKEGEDFLEEWMPTPLTEDMMKDALSLLCKTGNGLAHAYVKLEVKERDLTDIYLLRSYIHLRYVDVSENHLTDLSPLNYLTHLLWLKADGNLLHTARLNELPYLQIASFAYNKITDTEGISHPRLASLDLKGNHIRVVTGLDPQKLISLHTLELRGNQLDSTLGINLPKLKNLFLESKDAGPKLRRLPVTGATTRTPLIRSGGCLLLPQAWKSITAWRPGSVWDTWAAVLRQGAAFRQVCWESGLDGPRGCCKNRLWRSFGSGGLGC
ncbi:leucine-rich repeat-containing protein 23 isoform X2 [Camelus dromedarius]|uniref:leucine-rich repeat-containing protein 23 isoform X2 n=1 Tax=Camelus dromedarius TaxID=9838 RepID=UPI001262EA44|nr:leucine-rich repeat-containing protein 23 isoform X4 [Camelus dromedarius]